MMTGDRLAAHPLWKSFKREKNRGLAQSLENVQIWGMEEGNYTQKRRQGMVEEKLLSSIMRNNFQVRVGSPQDKMLEKSKKEE